MMNAKEYIAARVAKELKPGMLVNLGIGLPTLVANYIPADVEVIFHVENGFVGAGPRPASGAEDPDIVNAGVEPISLVPGAATIDSSLSFSIVRGGHLDVTVLGGLQVDEEGNLANWMVPGKMIAGMGGAMDLATGAKRLIVAMEHTTKDGKAKIVKKCSYPLTERKVVDLIVTELAVIEVRAGKLFLKEVAPHSSLEEVLDKTEASLTIDLK